VLAFTDAAALFPAVAPLGRIRVLGSARDVRAGLS